MTSPWKWGTCPSTCPRRGASRSTLSTTRPTAPRTSCGRWCTWAAAGGHHPALRQSGQRRHGIQRGSTVTYTLGDTLSLTLEFSQEAASLSGEEGERTLQAMAATFAAYTQGLDRLSFRCQGEELTVNGKTAQDFLDPAQLTITRTVETDYRE